MDYDTAKATVEALKGAQANLETGIDYEVQAATYLTVDGTTAADETYQQLKGAASQYYAGVSQALAAQGMNYNITNAKEASLVIASSEIRSQHYRTVWVR